MNQYIRSEWQLFRHLISFGSNDLKEYELYKACVPDALNGKIRAESQSLPEYYLNLLLARKLIYERKFRNALGMLKQIVSRHEDPLIKGDGYFLIGALLHQKGHLLWSGQCYNKSEQLYSKSDDQHKYLRSLINKKISQKASSEHIKSYFNGEIYFLKHECVRQSYFDLCGNIEKSKSCDLMVLGNFEGALSAAKLAHQYYIQDGSSNDGNIALLLMAISYYSLGQKSEAVSIRSTLQLSEGKYRTFLDVYDQIAQGKKPNLRKEHPLYGTPWPIYQFRKNSIVGMVYGHLLGGPVSREDLIKLVWGPSALDPSYIMRLHTVIAALRNKYHFSIEYDGTHYNLISNKVG